MSAIETFFSAWRESDAGTRGDLMAQSLADDATYSDPRSGGRLAGGAAIADYVGMFSANAPGWGADVVQADDVNGYVRVLVAFGGPGPDGDTMTQHGTYFADLDGAGKIKSLAGFVGVAAPE